MPKSNNLKMLQKAYQELLPYSKKYRVDFKRYLFSLDIITNIRDLKDKKILDLGTGIGIMPLALKFLGLNSYGQDYYIFPENGNQMFGVSDIDKLKDIWTKNNLIISNKNIYASDFDFHTESFDFILSEATIEHLKDPKKFIEQIIYFLKPNGYLLISTPNLTTLLKRLRFLLGKSPNWPIEDFYKAGDAFTGHWREYTLRELKYICQASDLKIIQTYNKNLLSGFKNLKEWQKNYRALIALIANLIPGSCEMNYILCQKK